jgi:hypothetical protein
MLRQKMIALQAPNVPVCERLGEFSFVGGAFHLPRCGQRKTRGAAVMVLASTNTCVRFNKSAHLFNNYIGLIRGNFSIRAWNT